MIHPLTLENDHLRILVHPDYGGKVASVIDKADQAELLFSYPRPFPDKPDYDTPYIQGWYAGWDECFPSITKVPYPLHPYTGVKVPDHGELWGIPTQVIPSDDGIVTRWRGIRFAYQLSRHLRLIGSTLEARYTLDNLAPFRFHFVWALHSLMRMDIPIELSCLDAGQWLLPQNHNGVRQTIQFQWPTLPSGDDFSKPAHLPPRSGWKLFSTRPITRPFAIHYPSRKRTLNISYESDSQVKAHWGLWINTGVWAGHHQFAVEPTTGLSDRLDTSIENGSAASVDPQSTVRWTVRWTLSDLCL